MVDGIKQKIARHAAGIIQTWKRKMSTLGPMAGPVDGDVSGAQALVNLLHDENGPITDPYHAYHVHWSARWAQYGYPVFSLTHSLESALLMTDCSDVDGRDLAWPFDSFLIELPNPGALSYLDMEGRPISGRYVVVHRMRADRDMLLPKLLEKYGRLTMETLAAAKSDPETARKQMLQLTAAWKEESAGLRWFHRSYIELVGDMDCSVKHDDFLPDDGETLGDWINGRPGGAHRSDPEGGDLTDKDRNAMVATRQLVANLCLYVAGLSPMPRPRGPASVPVDPARDVVIPSVLLGTEVKLPREMRDAAKAYVERGRSDLHRAAWTLHSRHSVRGHWRNQPYGPRPDGRTRRQWIQPFWKGPQDAATIGRTYKTRLPGET